MTAVEVLFTDTLVDAGGETGRLIARYDWSSTPLGAIDRWGQSLKTALSMILLSPVPIVMLWGEDGIMLYNDAYSVFAGARHPGLLGGKVREGWPEVADFNDNVMKVGLAGGTLRYNDQELTLYRNGRPEQVWLDLNYSPILGERGVPVGVIAIVIDMTARVLAERRKVFRLILEERLRDLADPRAITRVAAEALGEYMGAIRVGYAEVDVNAVHVHIDAEWRAPGVASIGGNHTLADYGEAFIAEYMAGRTLAIDDFATDPRSAGTSYVAAHTAMGVQAQAVVPLVKAGHLAAVLFVHSALPRRWTEADLSLIEDIAERTWAAVERARAEAAQRELNETLELRVAEALAERKLLADIIDGTDVFVQVVDLDYNWLAINDACANEFSRIHGVGRPKAGENMLAMLDALPEKRSALQAVWARALDGQEFAEVDVFGDSAVERRYYEMRFRTLRDDHGRITGAYQFVYDVTERLQEQARLREAEAALQQAQKMDAVGQLTGGIAHDFNNLLQGVAGSLDLIRRRPDDVGTVRKWAEAGLKSVERGAKLTGQLLAFSRAQRIEARPLIVSDLVSDMRDLLERTLGPTVKITLDLDTKHPVLTDPTQLEMAILNLAINARDAMPQGGEVRIETRSYRAGPDSELNPGDYVEVRVIDTGLGMPPEIAARAFDPFFTTKDLGKGTGLGLSQVYGIARQAGGLAKIDSQPGQGTTIRLFLRVTDQTLKPDQGPQESAVIITREAATVLVIDDDADVRQFLVDSFEALGGYRIEAFGDGAAGLAALDRVEPDILVLDFAMPGMNGAEVARLARERRPNLPIVFASGYSDTAVIEGVPGPAATILRKPFRVAELQAAVVDALDAN